MGMLSGKAKDSGSSDRVAARMADQRREQERAAQKEREYQAFQARTAAAKNRADKRVLRGRGGS